MDDLALQNWSNMLMDLRQARLTSASKDLEGKGSGFSPADFFDHATNSVDQIVEKYLNEEQQFWDSNPPDDTNAALKSLRSEIDSVVDFELEAVDRDLQGLRLHANWTNEAINEAQSTFQIAVNEIRNKYQIKINNLATTMKKKPPPSSLSSTSAPATPSMQMSYSSSSGSGGSVILMFLVGLVLGLGPSIYFWDVAKKTEKRFHSEKTKLLDTQRLIEDNLAILHDVFDQLANGKMKNLRGIEEQIREAKSRATERKRRSDREYVEERERLLKKTPAGDRLDRALEDLEYRKVQRDGDIREQERIDLEKFEKQRKMIRDLLAQ